MRWRGTCLKERQLHRVYPVLPQATSVLMPVALLSRTPTLVCALFMQTGFVALPVEFLVVASGTMRVFCVPVRIAWISCGV